MVGLQDLGRGLFLVEALADDWGRYPVTARSRTAGWKVAWFEPAAVRE
ncbi:hypothetical protein ACLVWQ_01170 [Streptomyces sp. CWNU-52B]